jgi:hypothetical protein
MLVSKMSRRLFPYFQNFRSRAQRGNALFLVLIGVALFAALAYAVTQSGRSGGGSTAAEQRTLIASRITQMGAGLKTATDRLMLSGGSISAATIELSSFGAVAGRRCASAPGPTGIECTSGTACLFSTNGGNALVPQIPKGWTSTYPTLPSGQICYVQPTGYPNIGYVTLGGLPQDLCQTINTGLGISGIPAPAWGGANPNNYDYPIVGVSAGCFQFTQYDNAYYFYQLLYN